MKQPTETQEHNWTFVQDVPLLTDEEMAQALEQWADWKEHDGYAAHGPALLRRAAGRIREKGESDG